MKTELISLTPVSTQLSCGKHPFVCLIVQYEHQHLLHAGLTLMLSTLSGKFHITGMKKIVRSVDRQCITCRRYATKPLPQQLVQLPIEHYNSRHSF